MASRIIFEHGTFRTEDQLSNKYTIKLFIFLSSGDFDDIVANAVGVVPVFITSEDVKLTGDAESSIAGRSLVIHEQADDSRLKCCIITVDYIPPKN